MDTVYFLFNDGSDMMKTVETLWSVEDGLGLKRTAFGISSSGDDHRCYITRAVDVEQTTNRFRQIIQLKQLVVKETTVRDAAVWDDWMAKMVGLSK